MNPQRYEPLLPIALAWIDRTIETHKGSTRTVASFGFKTLPRYFSTSILESARVVVTDHLPVLPLSKWGLPEFLSFEMQEGSGITFKDTYFLHPDAADDESVHFHELVHVIQWQLLGPRDFLLKYAAGLLENGYRDCLLERMAYDHQIRFDADHPGYDVEVEVNRALGIV